MNRQSDDPEEALKAAKRMFDEASEAIAAAVSDGPTDYVLVEFAYEKQKPQFDEEVRAALEGTSILRNMGHGNFSFGIIELFDGRPPQVVPPSVLPSRHRSGGFSTTPLNQCRMAVSKAAASSRLSR